MREDSHGRTGVAESGVANHLCAEQPQVVARGMPVADCVRRLWNCVLSWATKFVSGRFWKLKVLLLSVAFSVLCGGGLDLSHLKDGYFLAYAEKVEHPLLDLSKEYEPGSHQAKMNYRLTVPVLLHPLRLSRWQVLHVALPVLTIVSVCLIILLSAVLTFQLTADRVSSLFMALYACSTYMGSFSFILAFDAFTMAQVLLAMLPGLNWGTRAALACSASFTDERGLMACCLVIAAEFCLIAPPGRASVLNKRSLAIVAGLAAYWLGRLAIVHWTGLPSPIKGVGPGNFVRHIRFWHAGIWFALAGGWLLFALAVVVAHQQGRKMRLLLLFTFLLMMFGACFANGDIMRTTGYAFPLAFVSLAVVAPNEAENRIRLYCFLAFCISAIGGAYNIFLDEITWFEPLPIALLDRVAQDLYYLFRVYLFGGMP